MKIILLENRIFTEFVAFYISFPYITTTEAMAEYYSLNLSEEVKKGMSEKALRGELQTPAPLGYTLTDGLLCPCDDEALVVKKIFELFVHEGMTASDIAALLNETGSHTKNGNKFQARSVKYILANPVYSGKVRWNMRQSRSVTGIRDNYDSVIVSDGRHEAIIDEETFLKAAENLPKKHKRNAEARERHELEGLLKCARCGGNMYFCGKIFRCGNYLNKKCAFSQGVSVSRIERIVREEIHKKHASVIGCQNICEIASAIHFEREGFLVDITYI